MKEVKLKNGDNQIEIFIRKSTKAKRLSIKVDPINGFELVVPNNISEKSALNFLEKNKNWVFKHSSSINQKIKLENGTKLPILGNNYIIKYSQNLRGLTYFNNDEIIVSGEKNNLNHKVVSFLKRHCKEIISNIAEQKAELLNVQYNQIRIKDTKTRWGSCTENGNLSFYWRLIFAPLEILEYVVCHEIAHLIEMNHSIEFWQIVESICPDYKMKKEWLRKNGATLHLYY